MLGLDKLGLDDMDKTLLKKIINHYNGGPVGLKTISISIGEDPATVEEVNEPFLIAQGFLKRTPRGREVTPLAYQHLQINHPNHGESL